MRRFDTAGTAADVLTDVDGLSAQPRPAPAGYLREWETMQAALFPRHADVMAMSDRELDDLVKVMPAKK